MRKKVCLCFSFKCFFLSLNLSSCHLIAIVPMLHSRSQATLKASTKTFVWLVAKSDEEGGGVMSRSSC